MTGAGLDPRRNAYRDDLAAEELRGRVSAPRFAKGEARQVVAAQAAVRRLPDVSSALDTQALFGEHVTVYDRVKGWCWVQIVRDGYVGYMQENDLSDTVTDATHRVSAPATFVFSVPDIKTAPAMTLGMQSQLKVVNIAGRFAELSSGGWVPTPHIVTTEKTAHDFVEIAEQFIGTPYLWGGRTRAGIDCSGLLQIALEAAGYRCPRDSDMQQDEVGTPCAIRNSREGLLRGDLIFWQGHVGIMVDGYRLLHANAHHMAVAVEPVQAAIARIGLFGSSITAVKRVVRWGGQGT